MIITEKIISIIDSIKKKEIKIYIFSFIAKTEIFIKLLEKGDLENKLWIEDMKEILKNAPRFWVEIEVEAEELAKKIKRDIPIENLKELIKENIINNIFFTIGYTDNPLSILSHFALRYEYFIKRFKIKIGFDIKDLKKWISFWLYEATGELMLEKVLEELKRENLFVKNILSVFENIKNKKIIIKEIKKILLPFIFENFAVSLNPYYFAYLREIFNDPIFSSSSDFPFDKFREHMKKRYDVNLIGESYIFKEKIKIRNIDNIKTYFFYILRDSIKIYFLKVILKDLSTTTDGLFENINKLKVSSKEKKDLLHDGYYKLFEESLNNILKIKGDLFNTLLEDSFFITEERNEYSKYPLRLISLKGTGIGKATLSKLKDNDFETVGQLYEVIIENPKELEKISGISKNIIIKLKNAIERTNFGFVYLIENKPLEDIITSLNFMRYENFEKFLKLKESQITTYSKFKGKYPFKFDEFKHPKKEIIMWKIYDFDERLEYENFRELSRFIRRKGGYWSKWGKAFYFEEKPNEEILDEIAEKYLQLKGN